MTQALGIEAVYDRGRGLLFLAMAAEDGGWLRLSLGGREFGILALADHGVPSLDGATPFDPCVALPLRPGDHASGGEIRVERLSEPSAAAGEVLFAGVCPDWTAAPDAATEVAATLPTPDFAQQFDTYIRSGAPVVRDRRVAATLETIDTLPLPPGAPPEVTEAIVGALALKQIPTERLGLGELVVLPLSRAARERLGQRLVLDNFDGCEEAAQLRQIGAALCEAAAAAAIAKPHRRAVAGAVVTDGSEHLGRNLLAIVSLADWASRDRAGRVAFPAGASGHGIFGPYVTLPAGPYAAHLCLKAPGAEPPAQGRPLSRLLPKQPPQQPELTVVVEVVDGPHFLARQEFSAADLTGDPIAIPFALDASREGSARIETRIYTCGTLPLTVSSLFIIGQ